MEHGPYIDDLWWLIHRKFHSKPFNNQRGEEKNLNTSSAPGNPKLLRAPGAVTPIDPGPDGRLPCTPLPKPLPAPEATGRLRSTVTPFSPMRQMMSCAVFNQQTWGYLMGFYGSLWWLNGIQWDLMDIFPLVFQHNYGKSSFLIGKSNISMAIFNSYVCLPVSCQT